MIWSRTFLIIAAIWSLLLTTAARAEFPRSPNLCVLPVLRGSPAEADSLEGWRMISRPTVLEGLAGPILYGGNRDGVWTVADGLYQPYGGPFPQNPIYDQFAVEADTRRIIGLGSGGIFAATPGTRDFRQIALLGSGGPIPGALAYIPHRRAIMVGYQTSLYRLNGDQLALVTDKLPFRVGYFGKIADLPKQKAVLITSGLGDVAFVRDDGAIEMMMRGPVADSDQVARAVIEVSDPPRVLIRTLKELLIIDPLRVSGERVQIHPAQPSSFDPPDFVSTFPNGTFIVDTRGLERLGAEGPEPLADYPDAARRAHRIVAIRSLDIALVPEQDAIYTFDGRTLAPIPNSSGDAVGLSDIKDLVSIGKVLVAGRKGLFELTPERTLAPIPLPVAPGVHGIKIVEMPQSKSAVLLMANGAYAIGREGVVNTIPGGEELGFLLGMGSSPKGVLSPGNELLFEAPGLTSLYRVVDRRISGDSGCTPADRPRPALSDLCFRLVEGADDHTAAGGFGHWVLAPTQDRLIIDTPEGLFQLAEDRSFGRVPEIGTNIRGEPIELPWEDAVFISGRQPQGSLRSHAILEKSGKLRPVQDRISNPSGTLYSYLALPSLRTVLFGNGSEFTFYLTPDRTIAPIVDESGHWKYLYYLPAEAPWLGGAVVYPSSGGLDRLGLFSPGQPVRKLLLAKDYSDLVPFKLRHAVRREIMHPLPRFRSILIPTESGLKRLTPELRIEHVRGSNPAAYLILGVHDPGEGDILFGTSEGLYRINEEGTAALIPEVGIGAVRVLQNSSAVDGLVAGGEYGLFRIVEGHKVVPIPQGDAFTIGAVFRAIDVPWARLTLIAAARGIFVLDHEGALTMLDTNSAGGHSPFQRISAFPTLRGVFALGKGATYTDNGAVYELGRRSADSGACSAPL